MDRETIEKAVNDYIGFEPEGMVRAVVDGIEWAMSHQEREFDEYPKEEKK